jgi:uncharacterized membrane protein
MSLVHAMATVVAPWADFYNGNKAVQSVVSFGHFGGIMTAGGFALAADRATLKAAAAPAPEHSKYLRDLATIHPIVLTALAVTGVSGLLMFAADLESLIATPAFWIKMGLVALLLFNGWVMLQAERRLEAGDHSDAGGWRRLRTASLVSLVLWFSVLLAGSILPNVS